MSFANVHHKMLRALSANDELALMNVDDPTLEHALHGGTQIHGRAQIEFGSGWRAKKLTRGSRPREAEAWR